MSSKEIIINFLNCNIDENNAELKQLSSSLLREKIERPAIFIGAGTCGLGAGADKTLAEVEKYLQTKNINADVYQVGCIGLCAAEPIMDIQLPGYTRISYKHIYYEKVNALLDKVFSLDPPTEDLIGQFTDNSNRSWENIPEFNEHPFFKPQRRIVLKNCGIINPTSIDEYIIRKGYKAYLKAIKTTTPEEVCNIIELSGLRGRGGGGFPTGKKWKMANKAVAGQKYIICNADEGDPGAFMDRAVIEGDPHRLLEGIAIGAYAIGATKAYIYIRAEYPLAIKRLVNAIKQAKEYGLLGKNISGSGVNLDIIIKQGAGAFVCGEETALMHSIEGKRGMPRPRPPFPIEKGLFGKPTVINNVETFANVSDIMLNGAEWYNSVGTATSKGTKVFALSGKINLTGLVEIPMGTTIRDIIFKIGGGIKNKRKFKAVQIGGPSGGCITEQNLNIEIDYESLKKVGAMMGSGGLVVMDEDNCIVDIARFFMDFIQKESCGKCIPCREGTRRMLEILEGLTRKPNSSNPNEALERFKGVTNIENLAKVIKDTSLCGLGQTAPNPILSTLKWFREEFEEHLFERKCRANVCKDLRIFSIDVDKCTGCTVCSKKCPVNAIIGSKQKAHFIVEDKCIGCGNCLEVCKFNAVFIK
ncbi:MAG: NADH-quinone oxidoreductase subunit NuoF [Bacteroidales bacterium]|nr:NADH-quinone oxidoreductase subunit NuoF [Bacteroidales bacterium]